MEIPVQVAAEEVMLLPSQEQMDKREVTQVITLESIRRLLFDLDMLQGCGGLQIRSFDLDMFKEIFGVLIPG